MSEAITKRLLISGLTPQISQKDLQDRFSSFGTVTALDGVGKLDGVGEPRRFAYLTLNSTKGQLSKCLNLLSGSTWKGAKLRIGEAKPDFHERIVKENEAVKRSADDDSTRPKKRKRLLRGCQGVHSSDMSLVTPENISARPRWIKTPLGRLIRPIRMRPPRPLPPPTVVTKVTKAGTKYKRTKRRKAALLTRARRRTIDPSRWESEYLKGILLENSVSSSLAGPSRLTDTSLEVEEKDDTKSDTSSEEDEEPMTVEIADQPAKNDKTRSRTAPSPTTETPVPDFPPAVESSIAQEAAKDLILLSSLFGGTEHEADDWGGEESLSDIDIDQAHLRTANVAEADVGDIEIIPRNKANVTRETAKGKVDEKQGPVDDNKRESNEANVKAPRIGQAKAQKISLKEMFAPRMEDAVGFSLLGSLDADLELDDTIDIPAIIVPYPRDSSSAIAVSDPPLHTLATSAPINPQFKLDHSAPLFFPIFDADARRSKGRVKDILDIAKEKGWDEGFYRTDGEEEIRRRWEKARAELTGEWKRRHREGVKSVRRRGGGQD